MQKAWTSMNRSLTLIILFLIRLCKKTQTSLTSLFCIYLSLMFSQDDIQFVMYKCTNSVGSSTAVVSLFTTSIECRLISILTRTVKYSEAFLVSIHNDKQAWGHLSTQPGLALVERGRVAPSKLS